MSAIRVNRAQSVSTPGRALLAERLRTRRSEIEDAMVTRISAIGPGSRAESLSGGDLRDAVAPGLDYAFAILEQGGGRSLPVPAILLAQTRIAARCGTQVDIFLRRYVAGHSVFCDFLTEEAEAADLPKATQIKPMLRAQAAHCDRLLAAVSEEHTRESQKRIRSSRQRRAELADRLLAGELVDTTELAYEFDGWHIGGLAKGANSAELVRTAAAAVDRHLLLVERAGSMVWFWLGGRRRLDTVDLLKHSLASVHGRIALAIGEPGEGLPGWRLTHRQASAAMQIATRGPENVVRYADVALLASALQDELLATSLRQLYLAPLERERDGGRTLCDTLRAYFASERNVSSTASALGVSRNTVSNRIRTAESTIGRSIAACAAELESALRLEERRAAFRPPA